MTSINAIRFNRYEGVLVCDESITSSDDMRLDVSDKIQPCLPDILVEKYGCVASIGTTGTCSIGDEIKSKFTNRILSMYEAEVEKIGKAPNKFMPLSEMSKIVFDVIVDIKYQAMSNKFMGDYGFSVGEFMEGSYTRGKNSTEIKDKETIREISSLLTWKTQQAEVGFIFLNAVIFAGYDDENGLTIFHHDLRSGHWHKVQTCYLAEGSGRHSVDPTMYNFAENLLLENRRGDINRVEGVMFLLHALNTAIDHEIGVGGYPNITIINGREKDHKKRLREMADEKSHLAAQIMRALARNYVEYKDAYAMIDELIYGNTAFESVYEKFFAKAKNGNSLKRMLRGYKILPYHQDIF